jgi:low temperature requirement protein LtrA
MKKNNLPVFYYYTFGAQVALTILASVLLGHQLDKWFKTTNSPFMVALAIISIIYSLFDLVKRFKKKK